MLVVLLMLGLVMAGCLGQGGEAPPDDGGDGQDGDGDDGPAGTVELSANESRGIVPLHVAFALDAPGFPDDATWELDYGDDNRTDGTVADLPAEREHVYEGIGFHLAELTVRSDEGLRSDAVAILVRPPPPPPPIVRKYNDTALAGLPHPERVAGEEIPDAVPLPTHAELAKAIYDNGGNGTVLVGYEVELDERYTQLVAVSFALPRFLPNPPGLPACVPDSTCVPDYDLYLFDPDGNLAAQSTNNLTAEQINVTGVTAGNWTVLLVFWAGADPPEVEDLQSPPVTTFIVAV